MEDSFAQNKKKYIGVLGAFALSVGTSIGWGLFFVIGSNCLSKAGLLGSIIGIVFGALLMGVIATGMAIHSQGESFNEAFHHADAQMYAHRKALKKSRPSHNLR